ncbi:MAG TPA: hypothetical protein VMW25_04415 [Clostridia bacterium]|nr:hypothetical protein [Clostridia bacterium]
MSTTITKLSQLLRKKFWLEEIKEEIEKEKFRFNLKIVELKIKLLKAGSGEEKSQIAKEGNLTYQTFKEKILKLLTEAKEV